LIEAFEIFARESMMPAYILCLDQGTTGTTSMIIDAHGKVKAVADEDFKQIYPRPGWVEHRPKDIWQTVERTARLAMKKAKIRPEHIKAIGITNQRETTLVWDRKTGREIHNAVVWQDRRTSDRCAELKSQGHEARVREKTGLRLDPYFSATKIQWLLENISGAKAQAHRGELAAGTVDSFLVWKLSSGKSHITDVSNASRTLLMNLKTQTWDEDLLRLFDVPDKLLPEITDSSGILAETYGLKFLPDGIPISGIAGDQQSALFGQLCFDEGESKCTFGTGSFLLMNTGSEIVTSKNGLLSTAAWRLSGEKCVYALEGGAYICGAAVQFLRDQLGFIQESSDIERLAKSVSSSEGVEFIPAMAGLGAPYWDPDARGMICGLTRGTTRAHIARATLEAMALQNVDILQAMQADLGQKMKSVRVDGGASANRLLMQMQADYLGVAVVKPRMIETTSLGAGFLAGLGSGIISSKKEILKNWKIDREFKTQISAGERALRLKAWHIAVGRARSQEASLL
jgi:glycerol kinase